LFRSGLETSGEKRVLAIIFPAHATDLCRVLDLSFFGALKHLNATAQGEFDEEG
jgi:hypothetical protein